MFLKSYRMFGIVQYGIDFFIITIINLIALSCYLFYALFKFEIVIYLS